jgi:hypothetical protein
MARSFIALLAFLALAACDPRASLEGEPDPIGDFALGFAIAVAKDPVRGPASREASDEEIEAAVRDALEERFRRFSGDKLYHIAVRVEGYVLAQPGIPVVLSPNSTMIVSAILYDDAAQARINIEDEQITALEPLNVRTVVGSGITQTREQQLENLARGVAAGVERWMRANPQWFGAGAIPGSASAETAAVPESAGEAAPLQAPLAPGAVAVAPLETAEAAASATAQPGSEPPVN